LGHDRSFEQHDLTGRSPQSSSTSRYGPEQLGYDAFYLAEGWGHDASVLLAEVTWVARRRCEQSRAATTV
jgi:hypothetical protein